MFGEPALPKWRAHGWEPGGWLRGRALRQALVLLLSTAHQPCTIAQLVAALEDHGFRPMSQPPNKAVADALRYEVDRERVIRVGRGVYRLRRPLPYSTRRRYQHFMRTGGFLPDADVRKRLADARRWPGGAAPERSPSAGSRWSPLR